MDSAEMCPASIGHRLALYAWHPSGAAWIPGGLAFGAVQSPGVRNQRGFHSTMFFTVELTLGARVCSKQSFPKSHHLIWVMPANNIVRKRE